MCPLRSSLGRDACLPPFDPPRGRRLRRSHHDESRGTGPDAGLVPAGPSVSVCPSLRAVSGGSVFCLLYRLSNNG